MKIPTAAILGILVAGVSTLAGPPEQRARTTQGHPAPAGRRSEGGRSARQPGTRGAVAGVIDEIFAFRLLLRCSITIEEVETVSCRAQVARSRGST